MAKKSRTKQAFGSKSAFVRRLPSDMPAKEVVAQAASRGMKLSIGQVYNIRSVAKKRGDVDGRKRGGPGRPKAPVGPAGAEAQLRKIIAEVGLARAREVMADVEAAFRG